MIEMRRLKTVVIFIQTILSVVPSRKIFSCFFFFPFFNLDSSLNIFKKKMTLIADVFLNLMSPEEVVSKRVKSPIWEEPLTSKMVNGPKHC